MFHYFQVCLHFILPDLENIHTKLKDSIIGRCKNFMSNDWLPKDCQGYKTIPVQGYYIEPRLTRTVKKGLKDEQVSMNRLYDVFTFHTKSKTKILAVGKK